MPKRMRMTGDGLLDYAKQALNEAQKRKLVSKVADLTGNKRLKKVASLTGTGPVRVRRAPARKGQRVKGSTVYMQGGANMQGDGFFDFITKPAKAIYNVAKKTKALSTIGDLTGVKGLKTVGRLTGTGPIRRARGTTVYNL